MFEDPGLPDVLGLLVAEAAAAAAFLQLQAFAAVNVWRRRSQGRTMETMKLELFRFTSEHGSKIRFCVQTELVQDLTFGAASSSLQSEQKIGFNS